LLVSERRATERPCPPTRTDLAVATSFRTYLAAAGLERLRLDVVAQLAKELEARRLVGNTKIVSIDQAKHGR
jgi:hypothetical protein